MYNTKGPDAGLGPQSGTGMYYAKFDFNIAGLVAGHGIHFDLYSEDLRNFAPFGHDAERMVTAIPEPDTYAMLLASLGLMGFLVSRRKRKLTA